jgi:hypothetical protein
MFSSNPSVLGDLTSLIVQAGLEAGLTFRKQPIVRIYPDSRVGSGTVRVRTQDPSGKLTQTAAIEVNNTQEDRSHLHQLGGGAALIVDGVSLFVLDSAVINIGRQDDNHLVINDRRVSRRHAQVRSSQTGHMIFDLGSAGGTWVNGQRVNQRVLAPGDLISLAGVPLIYRRDASRRWRTGTKDLDSGV